MKDIITMNDDYSYYDELSNRLGLSEGGVDRLNTPGSVISMTIVPEEDKKSLEVRLTADGCTCLGSFRNL